MQYCLRADLIDELDHVTFNEGLHSRQHSKRTYESILQRAVAYLRQGARVFVDAMFRDPLIRQQSVECITFVGCNV